jgi:hypothetical protein
MRLLQVGEDGEISFVEFIGQDVPPYAILSHTWGPAHNEVLFADIINHTYKGKVGCTKIRLCGNQAMRDGLKYFWVDTCCINKESSAELTEAINSMYVYYRHADVCYAYLSDVHDITKFRESRWFDRGWTLQELLAPADVLFFDSSWTEIGFKTSLTSAISQRTGIGAGALCDGTGLERYSIAERMSWAADRQTSRIEDEAYCLLGLFDVNMPLIYGEGRRAFVRLQEELLARSDDASIFAFFAAVAGPQPPRSLSSLDDLTMSQPANDTNRSALQIPEAHQTDEVAIVGTTGLFSTSPNYFAHSAGYVPYPVLNTVLKQQRLPAQSSSRIRRSGHLLKFQGVFWHIRIHHSSDSGYLTTSDDSVQKAIAREHGVRLTLSSVRKLRMCAEKVNMTTWTVAFLDCRRRRGGFVGILLHKDNERGTYSRQHFPSIIETELHSFENVHELQVHTIYMETKPLTFASSGERISLDIPRPLQYDDRVDIAIRSTNMGDFGFGEYSRDDQHALHLATFWHTTDMDIPLVALSMNPRLLSCSHERAQGVICTLYSNAHLRYLSHIELSEREPLDAVSVPIGRGLTTYLDLNNDFQLVLRSQMQWKRQSPLHNVDRLEKQCLLTLTLVRRREVQTKSLRA